MASRGGCPGAYPYCGRPELVLSARPEAAGQKPDSNLSSQEVVWVYTIPRPGTQNGIPGSNEETLANRYRWLASTRAAGLLLLLSVVAVAQQPELKLPYPDGVSFRCTQGAPGEPGSGTHNNRYTYYDLDLQNLEQRVILAAAPGVAYTKSVADGFGHHVNIDHGAVDPTNPSGPRYFTVYAHLRGFLVKNGERVLQGQPIGMEGNSGTTVGSTGIHVHFGLHRGDPTKPGDREGNVSVLAERIVFVENGQPRALKSTDFALRGYTSNNPLPPSCLGNTEWNFARDSQCWTLDKEHTGSGFAAPDAWILNVATDPQAISPPLSFDATQFAGLEVSMANEEGNTKAEVFFTTDSPPTFDPRNMVSFDLASDRSYRVYAVTLRGHPGWRGRVTALRFDPVLSGTGKAVGIQWIRLVPSTTNCPGCGAPSTEIGTRFATAFNAEGAAVLGQPTGLVTAFVEQSYSPAIRGYYQNFRNNADGRRATIQLVEGAAQAYSVKYGFYEAFDRPSPSRDKRVYNLLVAPIGNESPSMVPSRAGTDYAWQPFLKGSMYFFRARGFADRGFGGTVSYVWEVFATRYEREGGRTGAMGLPLWESVYFATIAGWEVWYQWLEHGFIFRFRNQNSVWTYAYSKPTDILSGVNDWRELGWFQHQ